MMRMGPWAAVVLAALVGCGDGAQTTGDGGSSSSAGGASASASSSGGASATSSGSGGAPTTFGGERPVTLSVPDDYDGSPAPLVLSLHGYSGTGAVHEAYFQLRPAALSRGMLFAHPDGLVDPGGYQYWNANAACCDFGGSGVDDSGYLRGLIEEIQAAYAVDAKRIFLVGHSNGHFMSYRMACDHADLIAGVAGLAGSILPNGMGCSPSEPVHHLHVHGTADTVVPYDGGTLLSGSVPIASAEAAVAFWASQAGCDATATQVGTVDLVTDLAGDETQILRHEGCGSGGSAELWRILGGAHVPSLATDWADRLLDHLLAHPKP